MPTYEYRCEECRHTFERSEALSEHEASKPNCPECGSERVTQVLGAFYPQTAKKS